MRFTFLTGFAIKKSTLALGLSSLLGLALTARAEPSKLDFSRGSYELASDAQGTLKNLAAELKAKPESGLTIDDGALGLKTSSLPYIVRRTRSLKIVQALVRDGIDAGRIEIVSASKADSKDNAVRLELNSKAAIVIPKIVPSADVKAGAKEFTLRFPSASAVPENLDQDDLAGFLGSVGQPDRDAIVIEGYTDSVGNATYNQALGELRALSVFDLMVRKGLPPYRVDTKSVSKSSEPGKGKDSAEDRKVIIRWTVNEAVATTAKVEDKVVAPVPQPVAPPPPVSEPAAAVAPAKAEEPAPVEPAKDIEGSNLDLIIFGGLIQPGGELKDHAKSASTFGLGIGKAFVVDADKELRASLFLSGKSTLDAKESSLSGPLDIRFFNLRADYVFGSSVARPFVGIGLGNYVWKSAIVQNVSQLKHNGSKSDAGGNLTLGLDISLMKNLFLAPELSWHKIGGDFSESIFIGDLALRWRI